MFNIELNPESKTDLNEKVLKDKRKKIKETFERVLRLYVSILKPDKEDI